jgi:hypothetical protein
VIVDKVDIAHIAVGNPKDDAPVSPHRNGPKSLQVAFERMQPKARTAKSLDDNRIVQPDGPARLMNPG